MHEFSICQALVAAVLKELGKVNDKQIRLKKVRVAVGQYHRIMPGSLKLAYKILTKNTPAEGSALQIRSMPIKIKCKKCDWEGSMRDFILLCKKCGGADTEITGGKELCLESIEVESAHG